MTAPCHSHHGAPPSAWVTRHLGLVASGGHVLDIACGSGRHSRLALAAGHAVTANDRDLSGVADLSGEPGFMALAADLEREGGWPLPRRPFEGVIVTNYLWRPILPRIVAAAGPAGVLIYETFAAGQERLGRPRNPDFLLRPGELLEAVRGRLTPLVYEHVTCCDPLRVVQRIVAVGGSHPALSDPGALPAATEPFRPTSAF
jgi:hypothetical protein